MNIRSSKNKYLLISVIVIIIVFLSMIIINIKSSKEENKPLIKTGERKVSLEIEPEYKEYFKDQLIWIKVSVVNNSDKDYYIKLPLKRQSIRFNMVTPRGENAAENKITNTGDMSDSLRLEPGSTYEKVILLNQVTGKSFETGIKETGMYRISAGYQNLISDEIVLNISDPSGMDKEIYDKTYNELLVADISENEKSIKLIEVLKKYPGSKYSPQLYKIYFTESKYSKDYNNNSEEINDFFEYNYDTYGADLILDVGNVNYEKLLSRYRDSKTGYMIRQRKKETLTHK